MKNQKKSIIKTLRLLLISPFIAGFITAMIVFTQPDSMMMIGLAGMLGIWMIAAIASYKALKGYLLPPDTE